jgi:hypothetical protein
LRSGYFPTVWKKSYLVPLHKKGRKNDVNNYWGISILSSIPKLLENIICDQIKVNITPTLHPVQHGFESGKSTMTNLVEYTSFILKKMESGFQVDSLYYDFSKAFDRVDHQLLLFKLSKLGLQSNIIVWLRSYMQGRTQRVRLNDSLSNDILVTSGVPQGSHLGPLLFIMFVNDLTIQLTDDIEFLFYADDLRIYKAVSNVNDVYALENNMKIIDSWSKLNGMHLNFGKCNVISFTRRACPIHHSYISNNH